MYRVVQIFTVLAMSFYAYMTYPAYPHNYIFLLAAILLLLAGTFRKPYEALFAAGLAMAGYGGYELYLYYGTGALQRFGWHELIWLAIFPYAAIVGGLGRDVPNTAPSENLSLYKLLYAEDGQADKVLSMVDAHLGFIDGSAFVYRLEEEVLQALHERRKVALLLLVISGFQEYKDKLGYQQSQWLLNEVAEMINRIPNGPEIKAHLGEGMFAVVLPADHQEERVPAQDFLSQLRESFAELIMVRPRHENIGNIGIKAGLAESPSDGIEARSLMDSAQSELEGNGMRG